MAEASKKASRAEFPPVAGRPGFVAMPWVNGDGVHVVQGRRTSGGKLEVLAKYKGITIPFPATREALQAACAGETFTLPGGAVLNGIEAVAASKLKHLAETFRGEERQRLLDGGEPDAKAYQARINGAAPVAVTAEALSKMSRDELVAIALAATSKGKRRRR